MSAALQLAPSVIVLGPDRRSDMELAHEAMMTRLEKKARLDVVYQAVMTSVRELLAARALGLDTTEFMDRLEVLHTRELQEREGL